MSKQTQFSLTVDAACDLRRLLFDVQNTLIEEADAKGGTDPGYVDQHERINHQTESATCS